MIAFGPVPSRRLGRSLGINNIPPKICTYSCVYCQLGRTRDMRIKRRVFYDPDDVVRAVREKVARVQQQGERIDYLTFVPDGEPTLDVNLGQEIDRLRSLELPIAVITNGSLIWREDVRDELRRADWVSLKVDAAEEVIWRKIDRPHGRLALPQIQDGMRAFAQAYDGELVTETMLVQGLNDDAETIAAVADFLADLQPDVAYLAVPTRPPAEDWARPPDEEALHRAYQIVSERLDRVEYLIGYEGDAFAFTGDVEEDLLSIMAVHPMRQDAVAAFLERAEADWSVVEALIAKEQLVEMEHDGRTFYMRKLQPNDA